MKTAGGTLYIAVPEGTSAGAAPLALDPVLQVAPLRPWQQRQSSGGDRDRWLGPAAHLAPWVGKKHNTLSVLHLHVMIQLGLCMVVWFACCPLFLHR
jgi:hypothetical protein